MFITVTSRNSSAIRIRHLIRIPSLSPRSLLQRDRTSRRPSSARATSRTMTLWKSNCDCCDCRLTQLFCSDVLTSQGVYLYSSVNKLIWKPQSIFCMRTKFERIKPWCSGFLPWISWKDFSPSLSAKNLECCPESIKEIKREDMTKFTLNKSHIHHPVAVKPKM